MLKCILVVVLVFSGVFIAHADDDLDLSSDDAIVIESPPSPVQNGFEKLVQRALSGDIETSPQMRKKFAASMTKSMKDDPDYRGLKVSAEGKNNVVLRVSFPKANGMFSATMASQPDLMLVFYALGFKKVVFSNNHGDFWNVPIKLD